MTVFGGGIIPVDERSELFDVGMRAIFGPGTKMKEMADFVSEVEKRIDSGEKQYPCIPRHFLQKHQRTFSSEHIPSYSL